MAELSTLSDLTAEREVGAEPSEARWLRALRSRFAVGFAGDLLKRKGRVASGWPASRDAERGSEIARSQGFNFILSAPIQI